MTRAIEMLTTLIFFLLASCVPPEQNNPPISRALCTQCPGGICVDLASDPNNCGTCNNVCPTGWGCYLGICECGHEREGCCPPSIPGGPLTCASACLVCCPSSQLNPPYGYCQLSCGGT